MPKKVRRPDATWTEAMAAQRSVVQDNTRHVVTLEGDIIQVPVELKGRALEAFLREQKGFRK